MQSLDKQTEGGRRTAAAAFSAAAIRTLPAGFSRSALSEARIRNVCVTPGATLLFHAGGNMRKGIINPSTTQQMLSTYNAALHQYVSDSHFMDTFAFHPISGGEIIRRFGYAACR